MLNCGMREASGRIEIIDFSVPAVEASLRFVYSGKLEVDPVRILEVAAFADKYAIGGLKGCSIEAFADLTVDQCRGFAMGELEAANITAAQCKARGCSLAKLGVLGFSPVELIKEFDCNPKMLEEARFRCWFLPAPAPA